MLRRPLGVWFFALAVAFLAVDATWAQQPGQGRRPGGFGGFAGGFGGGFSAFGGGGGDSTSLLRVEQVQKELELLPEQVTDINKVFEGSRPDFSQFQGLRELSEEDRNKRMEEIRAKMQETQKANRTKINEILLPHQAERLKGITIQVRGAGALDDPEIQSDLKITDEQKEKIASAREAQRTKMGELFQQQGRGDDNNNDEAARQARQAKFDELRKSNEEEIFAVLKPEQRDQLEKMKGDKFELDRSQFQGRGPGGPGGPGQSRFGGNRRPGEGGGRPEGDGGNRPGGDGERRRPTNDEDKPKET